MQLSFWGICQTGDWHCHLKLSSVSGLPGKPSRLSFEPEAFPGFFAAALWEQVAEPVNLEGPSIWEMDGTQGRNQSPHLYYKASLCLQAALWVVQQSQERFWAGLPSKSLGSPHPKILITAWGESQGTQKNCFLCVLPLTQKLPKPLGFCNYIINTWRMKETGRHRKITWEETAVRLPESTHVFVIIVFFGVCVCILHTRLFQIPVLFQPAFQLRD